MLIVNESCFSDYFHTEQACVCSILLVREQLYTQGSSPWHTSVVKEELGIWYKTEE